MARWEKMIIEEDYAQLGTNIIYKKDFIEYLKLHNYGDTAKHFSLGSKRFDKLIKEWQIKKSFDDIMATKRLTNLNNGHNENWNNWEKNKETLINHNGSLEAAYNERNKKSVITCLEHYGVDNPLKSKEIKERSNRTKIKKYGSIRDAYLTASKKINYDISLKKRVETCKLKYGVDWYTQTEEYKLKQYNTKKKNNSFNISKPEELLVEYYKNLYGDNDIETQYVDERYPFKCDIYIKSEDKFIEFNGTWTHGKKPFDQNDPECIEELNKLIEKYNTNGSRYYKNAIYTWTILDVKKREYVVSNNLNYEVITYKIKDGYYIFSNNIKIKIRED